MEPSPASPGTPDWLGPAAEASDQVEQAALPTGAVALLLGVSPTTVRSWERRYGIGPEHRHEGHHRRWGPRDIAVLEAMCHLTARGVAPAEAARAALAERDARQPATSLPSQPAGAPQETPERGASGGRALRVGSVRPECRGLARAAVRLDAAETVRILREAVASLGVIEAWTEVMMPALRAAGRKWAVDGEQYVEVEHLLSWHVSSVLREAAIASIVSGPGRPVLLAAGPGEQHTLPLEATAAALSQRALPFRMLGAAVPPRALVDAVHRLGPCAVMLWSQDHRTADQELARLVGAATWGARGSRTRALVVAAGPGWLRHGPPPGASSPRTLAAAVDLLERATHPPGPGTPGQIAANGAGASGG
ncbi:MerR family transcriptional regulator [Kitasatospora sp. NPDC101801]|uniref:MerR family transcriptional regulator n=1 Tax=Kitasatospora sp. NPDC101801 TaxID=3364103 RepID=UPI00381B9168